MGLHGDAPEVMDGSASDKLRVKHVETGALEVKTEKERDREKAEGKRKKSGNGNLDAFVKKQKS